MAQINLLKQKTVSSNTNSSKIGVWFLAALLAGLVGYYGWLYYDSGKIDKDIAQTQQKISEDKQSALTNPKRAELLTRQQQLKNLNSLISSHLYWSQVLPQLAQATYNKASYSDLQISPDGTLTISATVPTLEDMDIYLQAFDSPCVYKYFSNVKIGSFTKIQDNTSSSVIKFTVTMNYDPSLMQYQSPAIGQYLCN